MLSHPSFRAKRSNPSGNKTGLDCFVAKLLAVTRRRLLLHQSVHVLDRLDKIFLEFLHHGAGGFHAVDQADALADEIADEVARLRVAGSGRAVDRVEGVAADDALQRP